MTVENLNITVKTNADKAAAKLLTLGSALEKVQGSAASVGGSAGARAAKGVEQVGKAAEKATKPMNNFLASLKRIAFYRLIRSIIKGISQAMQEGLEKAYLFSAATSDVMDRRFAEAMDSMKMSANAMKVQLGSAFIALLTALQPIIETLINLVIKAADAISQFFAALTGNTYVKANKTAAQFADTMARGGAAAKEWKNQLLGFDEINRLNEPNQGGGGGGANPLDGFGGELSPINDKVLNFVNTIKERLEPALERLKGAFERLKEAWGRFIESFSHGDLSRLIADLLALCGETIINGLTILADVLTLVAEVLTALNTGDWGKVWESLAYLIYDCVVAVSDLFVGLATLLYDAIIIVTQAIDDLLGTHFADWMRDDRDAFLEMYDAEKQSEDGLFGLKKTLGLTKTETDALASATEECSADLTNASTDVSTLGSNIRGTRNDIDWLLNGFRDFGTEVGYIITSLFQPLADLCAWIDSALQGFGLLKGINARVNQMNADGSIYLQGFASGGFPQEGQLFLANEGTAPEMVGTMGGRTAVATNADIVEGIRNGVYDAVVAANGNGGGDVSVKVYLDSREIKAGQQRLNRAWGV